MRRPKRLREFPLLTEERAYRLRAGLTLQEVSIAAGLTLSRASLAERHPDRAKPGELAALRAAVDRLASRAGRGPRFVKLPRVKRLGRGRAGRVIYLVEVCKGVVSRLMQSAMEMAGFWVSVRLSDMLLPSEGPLRQVVATVEGFVLVYRLLFGFRWWSR